MADAVAAKKISDTPNVKVPKKKKRRHKKLLPDLVKAQRAVPPQDSKQRKKKLNKHAKGLSKSAVRGLVSDIVKDLSGSNENCEVQRISKNAHEALREAAEAELVRLFRWANERAVLNKRSTVTLHKDLRPEITRRYAPAVYEEAQGTERAGRGLLNVTKFAPCEYTREADFLTCVGLRRKKEKKSVDAEDNNENPVAVADTEGNETDNSDSDSD